MTDKEKARLAAEVKAAHASIKRTLASLTETAERAKRQEQDIKKTFAKIQS